MAAALLHVAGEHDDLIHPDGRLDAIRDLLGLEIDGREMLPADDSGYGFDNIADVLALSPSLLERYMIASARVAQLAVADPRMLPTLKTYRVRPTLLQYQRMSEKLSFGTRGGMAASHYFPLDGEYRLKIRLQRTHASQIRGLSEPNTIEVRFDRKWVADFTVGGDGVINPWSAVMDASAYEQTADEGLELTLSVKAGTHTVGVSFPERRGLPEGPLEPRLSVASYEFAGDRDAPMSLESLSISGPYDASKPETTPGRSRVFVRSPDPATSLDAQERCATEILSTLARRAFRRPVTENDVATLLDFYREGRRISGSFDDGIKRALRAVLVDPEFLFRIEREPDEVEPGSLYRLSPVELASRLSFFLWSSIPDDALLAAAVAADPSNSEWLRPQVDRMLRDPRAHALVENFAGQWLYLRNLPSVAPDPDAYPEFDENLRDAFRTETELFVESQLRNDRSLLELLTADYTFVNERLARHYGIPNVHGNYFRRVSLQDRTRFGLLGQGSILTATSYPNRTSPTLRGKWVLENLLGAPPQRLRRMYQILLSPVPMLLGRFGNALRCTGQTRCVQVVMRQWIPWGLRSSRLTQSVGFVHMTMVELLTRPLNFRMEWNYVDRQVWENMCLRRVTSSQLRLQRNYLLMRWVGDLSRTMDRQCDRLFGSHSRINIAGHRLCCRWLRVCRSK